MPIKNALKIFATKFSTVYTILLYLVVMVVIIASASVFAIIPLYRFLEEEGVSEKISEIVTQFVINGYNYETMQKTIDCISLLKQSLAARVDIIVLALLYAFLVLGVLCRFIAGMLELSVLKKLQGAMSDNANYGFVGMFVSTFADSVLYSIIKVIVKFAADIAVFAIVYFVSAYLYNTIAWILVPFAACFILVAYYAFKAGLTACWGASIAVDGRSIFGAFKYSVKTFFSDFPRLYGTYVVMLFLLVGINFFIGRYTFGAGIVISLPISIFTVYVFNMTYFYEKRGYRYYVGGDIVGGNGTNR